MQTITISGYLSRDAEIRQTQNGDSIANWNVPVKQGWGEREQTNWFKVSIWGKRADFASKARKGEFVIVQGELSIGEYNGKPQYEIRASEFQSVRSAPRDGVPAGQARREPDGSQGHAGGFADDDLSDSITFVRNDKVW